MEEAAISLSRRSRASAEGWRWERGCSGRTARAMPRGLKEQAARAVRHWV